MNVVVTGANFIKKSSERDMDMLHIPGDVAEIKWALELLACQNFRIITFLRFPHV